MPKRPLQPAPGTAAALRARLGAAQKLAAKQEADCKRVVQELDVYREEVRQQTEELLTTQHALEASRDRYARLYDFAPIAYLTLDRNGVIEELNLTAARLLGVERPRALKLPFMLFVDLPHRIGFLGHMRRCRRQGGNVSTELTLMPRSAPGTGAGPAPHPLHVPVMLSTSAGSPPGDELRTAVLDLSERRKAQQQETMYQQRLRSMASELALAEERERRRIAVEIHDQISQSLAMAKMKLDALAQKAPADDGKRALKEVSELVAEVLGHTRSLTFELSPPVLHELGFEPALEWLCERAQSRYGLRVKSDLSPQGVRLPHDVGVLLFQAVRELLVNVVKHARARSAVVSVRRHGRRVQVVVTDDGAGFTPAADRANPPDGNGRDAGFGLFSIRTRLEHLGGRLTVESAAGEGSRVTLTFPIEADAHTGAASSTGDDGADGDPVHAPPGEGKGNRRLDESIPFGDNDGPTLPPSHAEGSHHESAARRRPSHRARRTQEPPRESA